MAQVEVSTTNYEFSHGKKPRGTGAWAFDVNTAHGTKTVFAPGSMSFTEAKAWVRREFPRARWVQAAP